MSGIRSLVARRDDEAGRRDLALAAVVVVGLSRLIEPPGVWLVAILLLGAILLGTLQVLGDEQARSEGGALGVPVESVILPAVAAVACVGAIRLVPFGLGLAPALLITGLIVDRCLALEARILAAPAGADHEAPTTVLITTLVVAFLGFVGVAAMIPGGLAQPGSPGAGGAPLPEPDLVVLAAGDAGLVEDGLGVPGHDRPHRSHVLHRRAVVQLGGPVRAPTSNPWRTALLRQPHGRGTIS